MRAVERVYYPTRKRADFRLVARHEKVWRTTFKGKANDGGHRPSWCASSGAIRAVASSAYREVTAGGEKVDLTPKEFEMLHLLASNPGRVFSREYLLDRIWGVNYNGYDRNVDNVILNIRKKLVNHCQAANRIRTIWGVGYKFSRQE